VKDQPVSGQVVHCRVQSYQGPVDVCLNVFAKSADKVDVFCFLLLSHSFDVLFYLLCFCASFHIFVLLKERSKVDIRCDSVEMDIVMSNDTRCVKSWKLPVSGENLRDGLLVFTVFIIIN
jgi:hypothetical protein